MTKLSRSVMLSGLLNEEGSGQALPFVRMFHGSPSSNSWEDSCVPHTIRQGEGGEQGNALMPLLFALANTGFLLQFSQSCKMENSCSRIWTTFTRWCLLTEWVQCTLQCNNICGRIVESECTPFWLKPFWLKAQAQVLCCSRAGNRFCTEYQL